MKPEIFKFMTCITELNQIAFFLLLIHHHVFAVLQSNVEIIDYVLVRRTLFAPAR